MECRSRASHRQFTSLLDYMERCGDIGAAVVTPQGRVKANKLWRELASTLNAVVGGVFRSPETWKKVWAEWKAKTKKKAALMKRQAKRRDSKEVVILTDLEERLLFFMNMSAKMPTVNDEELDNLLEPMPSTSGTSARAPSRASLSSTISSSGSMVPYTPPGTPPPTPTRSLTVSKLCSSAASDLGSDDASQCESVSTSSEIESIDIELILTEMQEDECLRAREQNSQIPDIRNVNPREEERQDDAPRLRSQTPTVPHGRLAPRSGHAEMMTFDRANHYLRIEKRRLKLYLMRERNEGFKLELEQDENDFMERCLTLCQETFGK